MNKLVAILAGVLLVSGLTACESSNSGSNSMMQECRTQCNRVGQSMAVTASSVAGHCVCSNDESTNA